METFKTMKGGWFYLRNEDVSNSSDVTITVPAHEIWELEHILAQLNASADAGTRYLQAYICDGTDIIWLGKTTAGITANNKGLLIHSVYEGAISTDTRYAIDTMAGNVAVAYCAPMSSPFTLQAGDELHIWDTAAIAALADDLLIRLGVRIRRI